MQHLDEKYEILQSPQAYVSLKHEGDKVLVFERNGLLFIFNLHPTNSYPDFKVGVETPGVYKVVLNSDDKQFGGHGRISNVDAEGNDLQFFTHNERWNDRSNALFTYIPSRTALVLQIKEKI